MFRIILLSFVLLGSITCNAFDTTKVLRYTEALSAKMDFPAVSIRFNGDYVFPDEEMASFTVEFIKEDFFKVLKAGGMNDHLYSMQILNGKKGKFITAINLRYGTDGRCMIKIFKVEVERDQIDLIDYPKGVHLVKYEDFGIDSETADLMRTNPSLIYLGYTFEDQQQIKVNINVNPPFGKENQDFLQKVSNAYPGILEKELYLKWDRKKSRYLKD